MEDNDRRSRLLTTREDITLNPWIQIPLCVIVLLSLFSFLLSHLYVLLRKLFLLVKDKGYLLGHKGIINTRRILIRRKVLWSRVCHSSMNLSLYCLTLFISCLLFLPSEIPDQFRSARGVRHHIITIIGQINDLMWMRSWPPLSQVNQFLNRN